MINGINGDFSLCRLASARAGQGQSQRSEIYCVNNQKQLVLAAIMYSNEFQDNWVPNEPGGNPG